MPHRDLFDIELQPAIGARFQPTGFPDIGAATFRRPVTRPDGEEAWEDCILVESSQSMANHLEAAGWDAATQEPSAALAGLPYVRVVGTDGRYLASSRTEAHRLAGAFIKDARLDGVEMRDVIRERLHLRDDTPLSPRDIASAVFQLDPLCLLHGVFFAEPAKVWPGQPKIARAVTAFVEAYDVEQALSGGVKRDEVRHTVGDGEGGGAAEGYGFVPFHRTEWVARTIVASFSIDRSQLDSYGLSKAATELLYVLARWEIRQLLDRGFRPRTACDLVPVAPEMVDGLLPAADELERSLSDLIASCHDFLGDGTPLQVVWESGKRRKP
jgi:CRISPR-associated protein Csb1